MLLTYAKKINSDQLVDELKANGVLSAIICVETQSDNNNIDICTLSVLDTLTNNQRTIIDYVIQSHTLPNPALAIVKFKVLEAMEFGKNMIAEFAAMNVLAGYTTAQVMAVADKLTDIQALLNSGSLYAALDAIKSMPADDLLSQSTKDYFVKKLSNKLGVQVTHV